MSSVDTLNNDFSLDHRALSGSNDAFQNTLSDLSSQNIHFSVKRQKFAIVALPHNTTPPRNDFSQGYYHPTQNGELPPPNYETAASSAKHGLDAQHNSAFNPDLTQEKQEFLIIPLARSSRTQRMKQAARENSKALLLAGAVVGVGAGIITGAVVAKHHADKKD